MNSTSLITRLVELVGEAGESDVQLILAGGLGVLLRVELARASGETTLGSLPQARATRDLDFLLTGEVIVDSQRMEKFRQVLDRLGYQVCENARNFQFIGPDTVKVDLHAVPPSDTSALKIDERRIRPRGFEGLHARRLDEALGSDSHPIAVPVSPGGVIEIGSANEAQEILTPNLFSYWAMKLFALRDNIENLEDDYGRRHAYDMYALWASTTERDWDNAALVELATRDAPLRAEIRSVVRELFEHSDSLGQIRLMEALRQDGGGSRRDEVDRFVADLLELLV